MKPLFRTTALLAALLALAALPALAVGAVGEKAPNFKLQGVDGKSYSLDAFKGKTVVLEWVNPNCPFSDRHAKEHTMAELAKQHGEVVWLGINSTNPTHADFLKPAAHNAWMTKNGVNYPVLYDLKGEVGKSYGASTTPHMFIIDKAGKIAYNGAIDDDPRGGKAKPARVNYVAGGLTLAKADKSPDPAATKPYGCSVKY